MGMKEYYVYIVQIPLYGEKIPIKKKNIFSAQLAVQFIQFFQ